MPMVRILTIYITETRIRQKAQLNTFGAVPRVCGCVIDAPALKACWKLTQNGTRNRSCHSTPFDFVMEARDHSNAMCSWGISAQDPQSLEAMCKVLVPQPTLLRSLWLSRSHMWKVVATRAETPLFRHRSKSCTEDSELLHFQRNGCSD